jgi:cytochrome c556
MSSLVLTEHANKKLHGENMKPLSIVLAAGALAAFGASAVLAQSDPIKVRQGLMKENNDHAKVVVQMVKGQRPFDSKEVETAFAQWAETAQKLPALFPENSKSGEKTRASPTIWLDKKDFDEKAAGLAKAVADNRAKAVASLDGLKAVIGVVGKACDNCHEQYRLSRH